MTFSDKDANSSAQLAVDMLQRGKLQEAAALCDAALKATPNSDPWLHVRGLVLLKQGDTAAAVETLNRAISRNRAVAAYHHALGNGLHDRGQIDRAISSYRRAIRLEPQFPEAHNDLGTAYFDKHWLKEAEAAFRESVRLKPDHDAAYGNLGAALRAQGKIGEARRAYQFALWFGVRRRIRTWWPGIVRPRPKAMQSRPPSESNGLQPSASPPQETRDNRQERAREMLESGNLDEAEKIIKPLAKEQPDNAEALHLYGYILGEQGKHAAAIVYISRAIALSPGVAKYHNNLGNAYQRQELSDEAVHCYETAIRLDPTLAQAHNNLSTALRSLSLYQKSLEASDKAIALDPTLAPAHGNRGEALSMLERPDDAIAAYQRALELNPGDTNSWSNLGRIHLEQRGDLDGAEKCFRESIRLASNQDDAHHNLGVVEQLRGNFGLAFGRFHHAQRLNPAAAQANFSESVLHLLLGEFERGWAGYHWRVVLRERMGLYPKVSTPYWDGSDLTGRSILIYGEQGLGDELMFASCLGEVIERADDAIIACEARLVTLFSRSFPKAKVIAMHGMQTAEWIKDAPPTDFIAAMGDLPPLLRRTADRFPQHRGYLKADPARVQFWQERLAALGPGKKIGISWRGGTKFSWKARRSLALEQLTPIVRRPGVYFINLQYGDVSEEIAQFYTNNGITIHDFQNAITDYDETAALVSALDLTISVCTAVVHLNGSLGKPVWVMAPEVPEWRYGATGPSMIWYPSARVFRQPTAEGWETVIQSVRAELDSDLPSEGRPAD